MSDLVKRLRAWHTPNETITGDVQLYLDAADHIEALEAALGRIARGGEAVLLNARGGITHMKNDPRLKLAMETMDWFALNRSWLVEATNKWYSHNKGLEMVDRLHEMDAAREQLRQMYIGSKYKPRVVPNKKRKAKIPTVTLEGYE